MSKIYRSIEDVYEDKIGVFIDNTCTGIRRFFKGIKNIFAYMGIIYRDNDWDYDFFIELVEFKLKRMRNYFMHGDIITRESYNEIVEGIDRTLKCIENYRNSSDEAIPCPINIRHDLVPCKDSSNYEFVTVNVDTGKPLTDEEEKIYTKYIKDCFNYEKEQWKSIWETIKEEGEKWWD